MNLKLLIGQMLALVCLLSMPTVQGAVTDDFEGTGDLIGYTTLLGGTDDGDGTDTDNISPIGRVSGRYRAVLISNQGEATLHFNGYRGRLDAKQVEFPFVYIARNIGIGTVADSQVAPSTTGNPFLFCGIQVKNLSNDDSAHIVIGHRGSTGFTIEGKNTIARSSTVNDDGANRLPDGRGDIRVEGTETGDLVISYQVPNMTGDPENDNWILYKGTGDLPGTDTTFDSSVLIGLITYAYLTPSQIPFVGTCDSVELVGESNSTIVSWSDPDDIVYGDPLGGLQLNATANIPGAFVYSPVSGTVLPAGNGQTLRVTFTPGDTLNYSTAQASVLINVNPAALTVTAAEKTKGYGAELPQLTAIYQGFVNQESSVDLDTAVILSTAATQNSVVGNYAITAGGAEDANYAITFVPGNLSVTQAPLSIAAVNKSRSYGAVNPTLTAIYSGFALNETEAVLDSPVVLSTAAVPDSTVAEYPIVASGAADANYSVTHVDGILTINPAALTATAQSKSKVAGQPNPVLTISYAGFANGEGPAALTQEPVPSTLVDLSSPPGQYPITLVGGQGQNYTITRVPGTLTVEANSQFAPIEVGPSGRVTLRVSGHPERTYRVQVSTNLSAWDPFVSIQTDGMGQGVYVEAVDPPLGNRYFRILWP